jgi:phytoene/squalene synthetase
MSPATRPQDSRTAATENFPVGSRLLPRALRPAVASFYRFARAADDIADNPLLDPTSKPPTRRAALPRARPSCAGFAWSAACRSTTRATS